MGGSITERLLVIRLKITVCWGIIIAAPAHPALVVVSMSATFPNLSVFLCPQSPSILTAMGGQDHLRTASALPASCVNECFRLERGKQQTVLSGWAFRPQTALGS